MISRIKGALGIRKTTSTSDIRKIRSPCDENSRKRMSDQISFKYDTPVPRYEENIPPSEFRNSGRPMLRLVLSNAELHGMMLKFCENEYTEENIILWDILCKYNREREYEEKKRIAEQIWNTFLSYHSTIDVNVKTQTERRIGEQMEMGLYDNVLFAELQQEVEILLQDSFVRFSRTKEYEDFMEQNGAVTPEPKRKIRDATKRVTFGANDFICIDDEEELFTETV